MKENGLEWDAWSTTQLPWSCLVFLAYAAGFPSTTASWQGACVIVCQGLVVLHHWPRLGRRALRSAAMAPCMAASEADETDETKQILPTSNPTLNYLVFPGKRSFGVYLLNSWSSSLPIKLPYQITNQHTSRLTRPHVPRNSERVFSSLLSRSNSRFTRIQRFVLGSCLPFCAFL
jgi:hypothetical protein